MNWHKYGMLLWLMLISTLAHAANAQLQNVKVYTVQQKTRIVLTLSEPVQYHIATLFHPPQIIISLSHTHLAAKITPKTFTHGMITHVRIENSKDGTLRLFLNLATRQYHQIVEKKSIKKTGEEIILELSTQIPSGKLKNQKQLAQNWINETLPPADHPLSDDTINTDDTDDVVSNSNMSNAMQITSANLTPAPVAPTNPVFSASKQRAVVIVIDPGHGGKDPGTTGTLGIREKDVVLSISRYLYQLLAKDPYFKPALTRTGDYFIPLRGRLAIARKDKGDMFVAVHADAYKDPYATGIAVFALSAHGASSEAARWLAEKENYSELGDVGLSGLTDKSDVLRSVLIDLSQTATISASMQLGYSMLQQLGRISNLHYRHIEQAPFMVLKSPDIPSLLVETGFLSSPTEERRLQDPAYQKKIAQALYLGIKNYYWLNPPTGTLIAAAKQSNKYNA